MYACNSGRPERICLNVILKNIMGTLSAVSVQADIGKYNGNFTSRLMLTIISNFRYTALKIYLLINSVIIYIY